MDRTTIISAVTGLALGVGAEGAIVSFSARAAWEAAPTNAQLALFAEPTEAVFVSEPFATTPAAASAVSGGSGWNAWTATASSGDVRGSGGALFTATPGSSLLFTFVGPSATPLLGVGLDVGFFDDAGNRKDGRAFIRLANGSALVRNITAAESFVGFWSSDASAPILSVRIQPLGTAATAWQIGASSMALATVPAPGAVALLGAGALIGGGRRRS